MGEATHAPAPRPQRLVSPCTRDCPAGIDVTRYIGYIVQGKFEEAEAVVREHNPFPAVCGQVCYRPCETGCRRGTLDAPVQVNALKRAAVQRSTGKVWRERWKDSIAPSTGKRVAVVGSGPAGLTAAYYLGKVCGHDVTVFESEPKPGGQLRIGIPDYRLPDAILEREIAIATETRVQIRCSAPVTSVEDLLKQGYDAVFVATGAIKPYTLGAPGEELPGVIECVDLLRDVGLGKKPRLGLRVAIVGGGNVAMDGARTALRLGAGEVVVLYRRTRKEMPAHGFEVATAEAEGVQLHFLVAPIKVERAGERLRLTLQQMQLGEPDSSGRRRPVPIPGAVSALDVDQLLLAIGQGPDIPAEWGLELTRGGNIVVKDSTPGTSRPGVFAAGDVVTGPVSVIAAIAGGRRAAEAIDKYLGGDGDISEALAPTGDELQYPPEFQPTGTMPYRMAELPVGERIHSFDEVELGLTDEQALAEARRCLRCDLWRIHGVPEIWRSKKGARVGE
ncbi:MAG: FAD-dependent oxidoreductase [Chloroflexota bacterium]|nr:FAD-dependent oxidoreductase [Chloroflexota bacterium]